MRRVELAFQKHIIDSYKTGGGYAKKWASEWQKGVPDLIASLPGVGLHLAEVKHRPDFLKKGRIANPLEPKQRQECRDYIQAGAMVCGFLISGEKATGSRLYVFDPSADYVHDHDPWVAYVPGIKYDLSDLLICHFHM
jgi:hypothetical protein